MHLSRRSLLIAASLTATPIPAWARNLARGAFTHSVASGDPQHDRVILWTRFVPESDDAIAWEIAEDESFATPVAHGEAQSRAQNDHCVKIDARGLQPNRRYFYRFLSASGPSPTGRTRTAPRDGGERLTIALFSCANTAWGYFHAYGHAAQRDDIDLAIHVGDYIYEYEPGDYPSAADAIPERTLDPQHECITLADYCARYANTTSDPDLLELRRLKPVSAIWDDTKSPTTPQAPAHKITSPPPKAITRHAWQQPQKPSSIGCPSAAPTTARNSIAASIGAISHASSSSTRA